MTELEKCQQGLMYDTTFPGREEAHEQCADLITFPLFNF